MAIESTAEEGAFSRLFSLAARSAMWGRTVDLEGTLSAPEALFEGDFVSPSIVAGADGQLLLSYVRYSEWSRARRVESRILGGVGEVVPVDEETSAATTTDGTTDDTTGVESTTSMPSDLTGAVDTGADGSTTGSGVDPSTVPAAARQSKGGGGCSTSQASYHARSSTALFWLIGFFGLAMVARKRRLAWLVKRSGTLI